MANDGTLLQKNFLQDLCSKNALVAVFLINGIKLQGNLLTFDDQVIILKNTTEQMVFKHAISTIVPA